MLSHTQAFLQAFHILLGAGEALSAFLSKVYL
jgi:hypothetical protein